MWGGISHETGRALRCTAGFCHRHGRFFRLDFLNIPWCSAGCCVFLRRRVRLEGNLIKSGVGGGDLMVFADADFKIVHLFFVMKNRVHEISSEFPETYV